MKITIRLIRDGMNKTIAKEDLPVVFELLEAGIKSGLVEEFQHTAHIKAYRRKEVVIGSSILSYDQQKKELIFFDHYQFKSFCDDMGVMVLS